MAGAGPLPRLAALLEDDAVERAHDEAEAELERVLEAARGAAFPDPALAATALKGER